MQTRIRRHIAVLATVGILALLAAGPANAAASTPALAGKIDPALIASARSQGTLSVIIRETSPRSDGAERLVGAVGGRVTHELPIIRGFAARIPGGSLARVAASPSVAAVWSDQRLRMSSSTYDLNKGAANTVWQQTIRLASAWKMSEGSGVTVALLDTGVNEVPDLAGRILAKVDFTPDHDGIDYFGHGTHMAGIIAGNGAMSNGTWTGVAPKTNLVSVKVARGDGSTDVSVVVAGLQWVYNHRAQYGIKVLNLSFGTDSTQSYLVDPLDYAVEQLWFGGVFVSTAAGNRGSSGQFSINKPGDDPFVETVGAADLKNTVTTNDDELAGFSSRGPTQDGIAKPEIVAPGVTIVSLRAAGSAIDLAYPSARVAGGYFKGTGTSQSAAVISGVAALMFSANPSLSPDVAKATLAGTANKSRPGTYGSAAGLVHASAAVNAAMWGIYAGSPANRGLAPSTGAGSLHLSRGSMVVYVDLPDDGLGAADTDGKLDELRGEIDALGNRWANLGWDNVVWKNLGWENLGWENFGWSNSAWSNLGWENAGWSSSVWSGVAWTNLGWENLGWENLGWENLGWESSAWSDDAWS